MSEETKTETVGQVNTETAAAATAAAKPEIKEPVKTAKSQFDLGEIHIEGAEVSEKPEQRVPLAEHIKLRRRTQAAEAKAEKLQEENEALRTAGVNNAGEGTAFDDDLPVTPKVVKTIVAKAVEDATQKVVEDYEAREQARIEAEKSRRIASALHNNEAAVRGKIADYDAVIDKAKEEGLITAADVRNAIGSPDPAKNLYVNAKIKLNALGIEIPKPTATVPTSSEQKEENTDKGKDSHKDDDALIENPDGFLEDILGSKPKSKK